MGKAHAKAAYLSSFHVMKIPMAIKPSATNIQCCWPDENPNTVRSRTSQSDIVIPSKREGTIGRLHTPYGVDRKRRKWVSDFEQELHDGMLTFFAFPSSLAIRLEGEELRRAWKAGPAAQRGPSHRALLAAFDERRDLTDFSARQSCGNETPDLLAKQSIDTK